MKQNLFFSLLCAAWMSGCQSTTSKADDTADSDLVATTGSLDIRFAMDPNLITSMDEPAAGRFVGDVYNADEVGALGPEPGAEALETISVDVDLGDGQQETGILIRTMELDVPFVTVLGYLDSDGNRASTDEMPDAADPVTLPGPNTFEVIFGQTTAVTVEFGILFPGQ